MIVNTINLAHTLISVLLKQLFPLIHALRKLT